MRARGRSPPSPGPFGCHKKARARKVRKRSPSCVAAPPSPGPFDGIVPGRFGATAAQDHDEDLPFTSRPSGSKLVDVSFGLGSVEQVLSGVSQATGRQEGRQPLTKAETAGRDHKTTMQRLASAGKVCRCSKVKGACHNKFTATPLGHLRNAYWSLSSDERSHLLRCLHEQAVGGWRTMPGQARKKAQRVQWSLLGHQVCFANFAHLLGHSQGTVLKMISGVPDGRAFRNVEKGKQSEAVDFWFYELYMSSAEPMPKEPTLQRRAGLSGDSEVMFADCAWLRAGDALNDEEDDEPLEGEVLEWTPDQPAAEVLHKLTVASTGVVAGLRRRWLPHQRLHDLYWLFLAAWHLIHQEGNSNIHGGVAIVPGAPAVPGVNGVNGVPGAVQGMPGTVPPAPSFVVFWRRWTKIWSHYLRIRKSSQHAQCQICFDHQQVMHNKGKSWGSRMEAAQALKQHYQEQYLDRCIYWSTRYASRAGLDVLCVIIDSPDKTHFTWPHWPWHRSPKCLDEILRPKMVVTGAIAHGCKPQPRVCLPGLRVQLSWCAQCLPQVLCGPGIQP